MVQYVFFQLIGCVCSTSSSFFFFFFKQNMRCVVLLISLPSSWDYRHAPSCLVLINTFLNCSGGFHLDLAYIKLLCFQ
uniref:Uncharacterized protein n=1 Tax=Chelonoidis abingdonii TaxID=106734 RepID=A0A8C0IPM8_CHEAB